ncbi:MAG TPA: hypothetical protein DDZ51_24330, partial [Planctomycetaceae bacterium]|nr:hypothetical protein [Planctomycetaceae bacterium]
KDDRVHYYGDDTWPILRRGFTQFFEDFLVRLNRDQLRCDTAFEQVERHGYTSGCLNFLWFRGDVSHKVQVPWIMRLVPWMPHSRTITGPSVLSLGDFVSGSIGNSKNRLVGPGGLANRFGFNDDATAQELLALATADELPDFTVAYFPNNDFDSHSHGPQASLKNVEHVDKTLQELADVYGGVEKMLAAIAIIVTGDHAQTNMTPNNERAGIDLNQLLQGYNIVPAGANWRDGDELMICPNMRAAQVYLRSKYWQDRDKIIQLLVDDQRIDQIIWRDKEIDSNRMCHVKTNSRGALEFGVFDNGVEMVDVDTAADEYGNRWQWKGDLAAVDGKVDADGVIRFGDYPNAFERIASVFDEEVSGDLWLTSMPGYEFKLDGISVHQNGSHGSLHADDSYSPLFMAGFDESLMPQRTARSVDVTPICLSILGIESRYDVGEGRCPTSVRSA